MTPTEALARARQFVRDSLDRWAEEPGLLAAGERDAYQMALNVIEGREPLDNRPIEQATEAVDREADYQRFLYPKGKPAADSCPFDGWSEPHQTDDHRWPDDAVVVHDPTICTGTDDVPCGCYCFDCNERGIHQAAEAADAAAEAAYQDSQNTDPQYREQRAYERGVVDEARRHPDQHPSAAVAPYEHPHVWEVQEVCEGCGDRRAVAPLDVEALREQVYYLLFIYGQMDAEHGHWAAVRRMLNIDAAYADAIRKRGEE